MKWDVDEITAEFEKDVKRAPFLLPITPKPVEQMFEISLYGLSRLKRQPEA